MLHKIRHACAGGNSVELPAEMPEFPHYSDPVEKFRQELERVGGGFLGWAKIREARRRPGPGTERERFDRNLLGR